MCETQSPTCMLSRGFRGGNFFLHFRYKLLQAFAAYDLAFAGGSLGHPLYYFCWQAGVDFSHAFRPRFQPPPHVHPSRAVLHNVVIQLYKLRRATTYWKTRKHCKLNLTNGQQPAARKGEPIFSPPKGSCTNPKHFSAKLLLSAVMSPPPPPAPWSCRSAAWPPPPAPPPPAPPAAARSPAATAASAGPGPAPDFQITCWPQVAP